MRVNLPCPGSAGAGCTTWSAACLNILQQAGNSTAGLVDKNGVAMTTMNNQTWGITYDRCNQMCNTTAIPLVWVPSLVLDRWTDRTQSAYWDFPSFSGAMTN